MRRVPQIRWERLAVEEVEKEYCRKMEEVMERTRGEEVDERSTGWAKLAEKVVEVAEEVCGVRTKSVENPWMVGKEGEISRMRRDISFATERKNQAAVDHRGGQVSDQELEDRWEELREARRVWKRQVKAWEKQW